MQRELLKMFNLNQSDEFVLEIKKALEEYFQKRLDEELDRLWDEGVFDQKRLDELRHQDLHMKLREYTFP